MGHKSEQTPDNSDEESGEAFTDGDFDDSGEEAVIERSNVTKISQLPINDTVNPNVDICKVNDPNNENQPVTNGNDDNAETVENVENGHCAPLDDLDNYMEQGVTDARKDSQSEINPSIVGILGDQHNHAEQRLAARRAARAEAREIRMRELERQQREQEDHADKAFDMYSETVGRRGGRLASLSPAVHSPRRSSEDSADDVFSIKDLRHELKEVEEKFRKAMILNAQLDNDKAALGYQLELLKDRIEELTEEHAQLQREHKEKCSAHERLKREHATLEREVTAARDAVRARDSAAAAAGFAFVEAELNGTAEQTELNGMEPELVAQGFGSVPPLALVSHHSEQLLNDAGEGTLDVRLQRLVSSKQALESEVRKLKLCLNEERAARQNGVAAHHDRELDSELESLRKSVSEAKGRAARAEAEAALQAAAVARLEAQVARLRARQDHQDEHEEQLKQERRRLQREAREALNRVEELETENSHLTKRLDKLKNAKSALLKEL
ncbi:leucine-rich repeat flightless-interacting protein 2 isoform X1 [Papilio machaon]|uniref:leucine-rich repeat flightless-interacting protein 2 isoform X1 n=1 Tax=Papilio machaon TaxID=76193 RepID=UPI001E6648D3|nr:leucine-rich repeat flightless-interacting protein 2 isoform X1 [Papilio machaon]